MKKRRKKEKRRKENGSGRDGRKRRKKRGSQWEKNSLKIHRLNPTASCDLPSIRFFYWYMHDSFSLVFLTQRQPLLSREVKKGDQDTPSKDLLAFRKLLL